MSGLLSPSYSNSYVYTHLGQLYQGPLNGGSTQEQYLYCNGSTPHQLLGLYPTSSGATCSNYTGKTADYSSSYDAFGNVTSRSTSSTTGTLSYDLLDQLTKWFVSSTNQEQYIYDSSGNRILRRSTNSSATTMTVYAFGLEEHTYSGSGTNQGNTYYYSLAGRLIGAKDANGTVFYMTDTLGSILASFTNTAGGAVLKGNQVYGPYGNTRYSKGTINTLKGFTGQYNDSLTGLDYYNARYYDPVAGVFLSADTVQGNAQGMNPYAYVNGNPETHSDPSGRYMGGLGGQTYVPGSSYYMQGGEAYSMSTGKPANLGGKYPGWYPGQGPNAAPQPTGHIGAKSVTVKLPVSSCDAACVARDENMIRNYDIKLHAQSSIKGDVEQLVGDILAAGADAVSQNWDAVIFDLLVSIIPHIGNLISDVLTATGHSIPELGRFLTFVQGMSNVITFMKGFFFLLGGIGELMYPLFHKAAATVGGWIVSGLASMWSGFKGADGMVSPDPSSQFVGKSPTQIQDLCIFTFGEGQGC